MTTRDYPDYTRAQQIIGSDVMVPIDLQAAYIMMPVDIQAQYLTLEIDIVAQSIGNLSVDLAAASIGTIDVDINAQSVGDISIEISAQNIGVQLQPDWQALQGNQKYFRVTAANQASGTFTASSYTVTAGKTLYITHIGGGAMPVNAADMNKVFTVYLYILNNTTSIYLFEMVKCFGGAATLPTPIKIPAGEEFRFGVMSRSNFNIDQFATAGGYEI